MKYNFNAKYNRTDFLEFIKGDLLPDDFELFEEDIALEYSTNHIEQVTKIGEVESLDLTVFEVLHNSENDPRVTLSRDIFRLMSNQAVGRALVIFYSYNSENYRLSLATIDFKLDKNKVVREYSNPKRYSYFLGPGAKTHTPERFLTKIKVKSFVELQDCFSIEVVNRQFYQEIATVFTELTGGQRDIGSKHIDAGKGCLVIPGGNNEQKRKEFTVRLIGRLVFCWFLKKKVSEDNVPLIPDVLLSTDAIENNDNYYHYVLEPLFFETLNKRLVDRHKNYKILPWKSIPFLNGGLFDPHEDDFYSFDRVTGISGKYINILKVPNDKLKELLSIFETYNFTIDENTSIDIELSIDPEMLGRIFENLLAEINPDTGETARKATGSYYTPREVVDYMVDRSLEHYLISKLGKKYKKNIESLLNYVEDAEELQSSFVDDALDALYKIKILDPACGSGAFPMGILQKILLVLQKLDPDSKRWLKRILDSIEDETVKGNLESNLNTGYVHKLGIIRDSIYGIDIQPVATEISKLRVFLSLIIDQNISDDKPNRGIQPLPNLEFKFVCANSLIGLGDNVNIPSDKAVKLQSELEKLRKKYLSSFGQKKHEIIQDYSKTRSKLLHNVLEFLWTNSDEKIRQISSWDPFSDKSCDWFDPEFMFGISDGFDIVIGNPPYGVSIKGDSRKTILNHLPKVPDYEIYYFFIELGMKLCQKSGVLTLIIPNTFLFNVYAKTFRIKMLENWKTLNILDCTSFPIFEKATVRNAIIFIENTTGTNDVKYKPTFEAESIHELLSQETKSLTKADLEVQIRNWGLAFKLKKEVLDVVSKIAKNNNSLSFYSGDISQGLIAYDKYRGQSQDTIKSRAYHHNNCGNGKYKKWLLGKDVTRYQVEWNKEEYIDYCDGIANPRQPKFFTQKRILIREITNPRIYASYTADELYNDPSVINILLSDKVSPLPVLGVLNSKVITFYHFNSSPKATKGEFPKLLIDDVRQLPFPKINENIQSILESLVSAIMYVKPVYGEKNDYFNIIDILIDSLVFKLIFENEFGDDNAFTKYLKNIPIFSDNLYDNSQDELIAEHFSCFLKMEHPLNDEIKKINQIPEVKVINKYFES